MAKNKKIIEINGIKVDYDKLTTSEMIQYIEENHPEDEQRFAKLVFKNPNAPYSHFRARKVFCEMYFPEVLAGEEADRISDTIKDWLNK